MTEVLMRTKELKTSFCSLFGPEMNEIQEGWAEIGGGQHAFAFFLGSA